MSRGPIVPRPAPRGPRPPARHAAGRAWWLAALALLAPVATAAPRDEPSLSWVTDGARHAVELSGLDRPALESLAGLPGDDPRWRALLRVVVSDDTTPPAPDRPGLLGDYRVGEEAVRFVPRFPLEPGLTYVAVFDPSGLPGLEGRPSRTARLRLDPPDRPEPTRLTRIDPGADVLPENVLRFYLHFSRPMSRGQVYDRVRLLDDSGAPVDMPFLEIVEELWDPSGTRLTLLVDPGRIKTGLRPQVEVGPVFEEGRSYTLVVAPDWPDAAGHPLREEARKPFRIGPPDHDQPDPATWQVRPPRAGTSDPLVVDTLDPLDRPLAERLIRVADGRGSPVDGAAALDARGTRFTFRPARPWAAGAHALLVGTALEDLAGNSVERPFEVDRFRVDRVPDRGTSVSLPFRVGP